MKRPIPGHGGVLRDDPALVNGRVDLGTYFCRVELADGRGWIAEWRTAWRLEGPGYEDASLNAQWIPPTYRNETEVLENVEYMYLEGNYSCDCNIVNFLARVEGKKDRRVNCGSNFKIKRLTVITPDRREIIIHEA